MAFRIYFIKKTRHPSISLSGRDKTIWESMTMTHHPSSGESFMEVVCITPKQSSISYIRKYVCKDKRGVKGKLYKKIRLSAKSELVIKIFLKTKNKKR